MEGRGGGGVRGWGVLEKNDVSVVLVLEEVGMRSGRLALSGHVSFVLFSDAFLAL